MTENPFTDGDCPWTIIIRKGKLTIGGISYPFQTWYELPNNQLTVIPNWPTLKISLFKVLEDAGIWQAK